MVCFRRIGVLGEPIVSLIHCLNRSRQENHGVDRWCPNAFHLKFAAANPPKEQFLRHKTGGKLPFFRKREIKLQKGVDPTQRPPYMASHRRGADGFHRPLSWSPDTDG